MEPLVTLLASLNALSPLAVIALLAVIIYKQVQGHTQVATLKSNDLHEMPEMAESLRRIEVMLATEFSYIRARLNGGSPKL